MSPDIAAASGRMIVLGALLTALAIGFRTQNALLTLPLLAGVLLDRIGRGFAPAVFGSFVAFAVGCLLWAVPLSWPAVASTLISPPWGSRRAKISRRRDAVSQPRAAAWSPSHWSARSSTHGIRSSWGA